MTMSASARRHKKERIMAKTDGHCAYCGISFQNKDQAYVSHLNHPETGAHHIDNLVMACQSCLNKKAGLSLEEFRQSESVTEFYFETNANKENNKSKDGRRAKVLEKTGGHCAYCGTSLDMFNMTMDHMIAKKHGGTNNINNLLPACIICNQAKSDSSIEEFREKLNHFPENFISSNRIYQCAVKMGRIQYTEGQTVFFYERRDGAMPQQSENMRSGENAAGAAPVSYGETARNIFPDESLVYPVSLFGRVCEELPGYTETMLFLPPNAPAAERFLKWVLFTWRQDWREMTGPVQRNVIEEMRLVLQNAGQERKREHCPGIKKEHCSIKTSCPLEPYKSEQTHMLNSLLVDALAAILRGSLANNTERPHPAGAPQNLANDSVNDRNRIEQDTKETPVEQALDTKETPVEQASAPQEPAENENSEAEQTAAPAGDNTEYRKTLRGRVRELIKEGNTLANIAKAFNDEKVPTLSGTGKWYSSSVSYIANLHAE